MVGAENFIGSNQQNEWLHQWKKYLPVEKLNRKTTVTEWNEDTNF